MSDEARGRGRRKRTEEGGSEEGREQRSEGDGQGRMQGTEGAREVNFKGGILRGHCNDQYTVYSAQNNLQSGPC